MSLAKMLPIGVSDFRKLIEHKNSDGAGYLFVDKTLLIKEILLDGSEVIVLPRPRRFGKTINLSMLRYFFSREVHGKKTEGMFDDLEIAKYSNGMKYQGQSPVVFLTFKDEKHDTFLQCKNGLSTIIAKLFNSYIYLLDSAHLTDTDKKIFMSIASEKAKDSHLSKSLQYLTEFIFKHHRVKPYILIDEYDIPIQEAYLKGYYDKAVGFIRNLFSAVLKDNEHIAKAVLTGIVRVSKESLFSGLNNIKIHSIFGKKYSEYFGFTEIEVENLLTASNVSVDKKAIKDWYNGYKFGNNIIYNPWSILNCIEEKGILQAYWVNTSSNQLAKKQIETAPVDVKNKLKLLIAGESITEPVTEHFVFDDLGKGQTPLWSLLALTGYLTILDFTGYEQDYECKLAIPNKEVITFYSSTVKQWLAGNLGTSWFKELLQDLTTGNIIAFEKKLNRFILESTSFLDTSSDKQEAFYHGLTLGLVAGLKDSYIIKSNRESGLGKYDLALIPHDKSKLGIIMEFKKKEKDEKLESVAKQALEQAEKTKYIVELEQAEIKDIVILGMAFSGKQVIVVSKEYKASGTCL